MLMVDGIAVFLSFGKLLLSNTPTGKTRRGLDNLLMCESLTTLE